MALVWVNLRSDVAPPAPVYCQFYWAEVEGKWLPAQLGQCCRADKIYMF